MKLNHPEDDDVCRELRRLQARLRDVQKVNRERKARLRAFLQPHLQLQAYTDALERLHGEIEARVDRRRLNRSKPNKAAMARSVDRAHHELGALLRDRRTLTDTFHELFPTVAALADAPTQTFVLDPTPS